MLSFVNALFQSNQPPLDAKLDVEMYKAGVTDCMRLLPKWFSCIKPGFYLFPNPQENDVEFVEYALKYNLL